MKKDILSGGIVLAVAGAYYLGARQILHSRLEDEVGADGLPLILAALLAALGVLLILRTRFASRQRAGTGTREYQAPYPRALGFLAIAVGYALIAPVVGYLVGIGLLITAVAVYEGNIGPSRRLAVIALGGAVGFWLLFIKLLGVEQPTNILF